MPKTLTVTAPNGEKCRVVIRNRMAVVSVTIPSAYVAAFAATWPCSGLDRRAIWFDFDKRNADLLDTNAPRNADGAALVALSHVAQSYVEGIGA